MSGNGELIMVKFSDSEKSLPLWQRLKENVGDDVCDAMRQLYSIYDVDLVEWFAQLYDTSVGGFYYSPSARDNAQVEYNGKIYDLLPDAESTCQALAFVNGSGIGCGKSYAQFLPDWVKKQIADYAYGLQDPDGFFYHPQWGKNIGISRRGRDFNWCCNMLREFGREKRYATLLDSAEDKEKKQNAPAPMIPEHLSSKEKFLNYLDSLNISNKAYAAGNNLSAQFGQIKSQGLAQICIDYLMDLQNPVNGLWHSEPSYLGVNGLMKISGVFCGAGVVLPHASEAAHSAIDAITSDEPMHGVVDLWNTWVAVERVCGNLRRFGGAEGEEQAREIVADLMKGAGDAIRKTAEKILPFKKPGSSFSYCPDHPAVTSQGVPVCIPHCKEGDINATVMSATMMIAAVHSALDIATLRVPLYGEDEGKMFLSILEKNRKQ